MLGVGAVAAVLLWVAWQFRVLFPPIVFAGAIVFILNPIVSVLQQRHVPRVAGTAIAYLGVVGIFVGLGFLIAPLISQQSEDFADQWPELRDDVEDWLDDLSDRSKEDNWIVEIPNSDELRDQFGETSSSEAEEFDEVIDTASQELESDGHDVIAADLDRVAATVRSNFDDGSGFADQLQTAREIGTRVFEVGLIFVIAPIVAFYILVDLPRIGAIINSLIPDGAREQVLHVAGRVNQTLGGFFRGQVMIATIVGIMVSFGLFLIDLPFWLLVGIIAGVFNMIPLIGPWVGAVPGVLIALTTRDFGTALWVAAIMAGAQQIDNHFISPLVMHRTTRLHPAVVMLALLAGGSLGGFFGLLVAVPLTATLKVVIGHLWKEYVLEMSVEEIIAADRPPPEPETESILEPLSQYVAGEIKPRRHRDGEADHDDGDEAGDDASEAEGADENDEQVTAEPN